MRLKLNSYERSAILDWYAKKSGNPISPITNLPISTAQVFGNLALRNEINEWKAANPHHPDNPDSSSTASVPPPGSR